MSVQGTVTVLVVDDHEITRRGLVVLLETLPGIKVIGEAADGQAAIATALELQPMVTLMDIGLPGCDGIEATRQIKQSMPALRALMFTSHDQDTDIFASLAAGADGYCLKDISAGNLEIAIKTVAGGGAWLDPGIARRVLRACGHVGPVEPPAARGRGHDNPFSLSPRELEVLGAIVDGQSNHEIAEQFGLSEDTVKTHVRRILDKLRVSDRTEAAVKAIRHGIF